MYSRRASGPVPEAAADAGPPRHPAAVLLATAVGLAVGISPTFIATFPVFLKPLAEAFGWSRGALSLGFAVAHCAIALVSPAVGRLVGRHGAQSVLLVSIPLYAAALGALSLAPPSFPVFLLLLATVGAAGAASNTFVYLSLFPRWFPRNLGMAAGFAMVGIGLGQAVMPILTQLSCDRFGWRLSYLGLAAISFCTAMAGLSVLWEGGRGSAASPQEESDAREAGRALRSKAFWLLAAGFFSISFAASGAALHLVAILTDRGMSGTRAATAAAGSGLAILAGRLLGGWSLDRFGALLPGLTAFACAIAGPLVLSSAFPGLAALAAPALLGLAIGVEGDLMPYLVREKFGLAHHATIYSWLFTAFTVGVLSGPLTMGVTYDRTGSYTPALILLSSVALLGAAAFWRATRSEAEVDGNSNP